MSNAHRHYCLNVMTLLFTSGMYKMDVCAPRVEGKNWTFLPQIEKLGHSRNFQVTFPD